MTLEQLQNDYINKEKQIDSITIPNRNAWLDENYEDVARIGNDSVYLDVKDSKIRKEVFIRSVFKYIQDNKWNTDIIKCKEDLDIDLPECKCCFIHDNYSMFPDYICFLKKDMDKFDKIKNDYINDCRTLWKTDIEFFESCIIFILGDISFEEYYHFIYEFEHNDFDIKFSDIEKDSVKKNIFMNIVFEIIAKTRNNKPEDD